MRKDVQRYVLQGFYKRAFWARINPFLEAPGMVVILKGIMDADPIKDCESSTAYALSFYNILKNYCFNIDCYLYITQRLVWHCPSVVNIWFRLSEAPLTKKIKRWNLRPGNDPS